MIKNLIKEFLSFPKRNRKLWALIRSVITGLPPVILACIAYFYNTTVPAGSVEQTLTPMKSFATEHPYLLWILLPLPIIITALAEWYEYFGDLLVDRHNLSSLESLCVLTAIDEIVGCKGKRFFEQFNKFKKEKSPITDVFERITNPQTQISTSITQLHLAMREMTQDHSLKTVLCRFSEGYPKDFSVYLPSSCKPKDSILTEGQRKTFFARVYQNNSPLCIPDIHRHTKSKKTTKLYFVEDGYEEHGSIVGFPIYHSHQGKILFVLTFRSDNKNAFTQDFIKKHKITIERFETRICLESTLEDIQKYTKASA